MIQNYFFQQQNQNIFLKKTEGITCNTGNEKDAIFRTIKKYSLHSSIVRTKKKNSKELSLENVYKERMEKVKKT